jgi:2-polyprenyl-3-methyl-5-hydroxy-6-metoxy-1,4-benzoquinol methylase
MLFALFTKENSRMVCQESSVPYFPYVLEKISECFPDKKDIRVLDYGCGNGELVRYLIGNGRDAYGVDVDTFFDDFYSYTDKELLAQKRIAVIDVDGKGDLLGQKFDVVISNMVIEHVKVKEHLFSAITQYMSNDGVALLFYPLFESIREGHIRQLFIHWFPRGPLRIAAAYVQKFLGIPRDNGGTANIHEFVKEKVGIVDESCFYETNWAMNRHLRKYFDFSHFETEYFTFRAKQKEKFWLVPFLELFSQTGLTDFIFRIYTGSVVVARKL